MRELVCLEPGIMLDANRCQGVGLEKVYFLYLEASQETEQYSQSLG